MSTCKQCDGSGWLADLAKCGACFGSGLFYDAEFSAKQGDWLDACKEIDALKLQLSAEREKLSIAVATLEFYAKCAPPINKRARAALAKIEGEG